MGRFQHSFPDSHFFQGLGDILEEDVAPDAAFDWITSQWRETQCSWSRVFWAGKTAIDNACDPGLDVLEFKPEIKTAMEIKARVDEILESAKRAKERRLPHA